MSRTQLVSAMVDLYGYSFTDFNNQTKTDIWEYLEPFEKVAVTEYVEVEQCLASC